MTNEEKTSFDSIVVSGGYPESLQKKAVKFSEEVSNGYHYKDLEVGFIRGYQSALVTACEWLEPVFKSLAGYYGGAALLDDFKEIMEE